MGYWLYYLACIVPALAVDRPWVASLARRVTRPAAGTVLRVTGTGREAGSRMS